MFFKPQHVHFTGIGGIGMSGLAEVLLNLGYRISGSDLQLSPDHRTAAAARARRSTKATRRETSTARGPWWSVPRRSRTIPKWTKRAGAAFRSSRAASCWPS